MASSSRIPVATYRLQFNKDFRFADACKILDYLKDLGISDIYASPILRSRHGSGHGYDTTDPTRIDPDLGSEEDFSHFQTELHNRNMGLILDIVPNHMAASNENPWWMDVLEHGSQSAYAPYFDIDWHPPARNLNGKILLPFLGKPFGETLDSGEISLSYSDGRFLLRYWEASFPVAPRSYRHILEDRAGMLKTIVGEISTGYQEYAGILSALDSYAQNEIAVPDAIADRRLRFESIRDRLRGLIDANDVVRLFVEDTVALFNGKPGDSGSFDLLERLIAEQHYRLAYWQTLTESINYRRFFTISDLVGVRVEDPIVFEATHGAIFRWLRTDVFSGLRIDHIDGLREPQVYLNKVQERVLRDESPGHEAKACVWVEKILARHEKLPAHWPISGTTGYDFLDQVNALFVRTENGGALERIYANFTGRKTEFAEVLYQQKKVVMNTLLAVEMRALGRELAEIAADDRYARELSRLMLYDALLEVTACLAVYRTYIRSLDLPEDARTYIEGAVQDARARKPHIDPACFEFVSDVLLVADRPHLHANQRESRLTFVMRWQQFTGPIVAKGQEDTALYVYYPLLSLNEVGSDARPSRAPSAEVFNEFMEDRQRNWPLSMNATTTHDTKRSEDVRARISVLSEIPDEWQARLEAWAKWNAPHKTNLNGQDVPDRNEEYFIYQTLVGIWDESVAAGDRTAGNSTAANALLERLQAYLIKATREAMVHTRWTKPNAVHEQALLDFVSAILTNPDAGAFRADFAAFHKSILRYGILNGLGQTLLKITCPGIPDFYQGSELWDLRLVDPDNRQPVDFALREKMLGCALKEGPSSELAGRLFANLDDPRIKLFTIQQALAYRSQHLELFSRGDFLPLECAGENSQKIFTYARCDQDAWCVVVVPRWQALGRKGGVAAEAHKEKTRIILPPNAPAHWTNVFTGSSANAIASEGSQQLEMEDLLMHFPLALLDGVKSIE